MYSLEPLDTLDTLDKDDDPFDETVWQKANPGLGICKRWDDLRRLAKKAKV